MNILLILQLLVMGIMCIGLHAAIKGLVMCGTDDEPKIIKPRPR